MKKRFLQAFKKAESIDEKNYSIDFIMTIEDPKGDRHGDMVDVDTIKYEEFEAKNPVVLPAHDHNAMAVAKVVNIRKEIVDGKKALVGTVIFAVEEYDLAKTYWNLYKGGFMNAVSIGFIPESGEMVDGVFVLYGSELLELSFVSIPANQLALAKAKGIDIKSILDTVDKEAMFKEMRETMVNFKNFLEVQTDTKILIDAEPDTPPDTTPDEPVKPKKLDKNERRKRLFNKAIRSLEN